MQSKRAVLRTQNRVEDPLVVGERRTGRTFVLRPGRHVIGRHNAADIRLEDVTVSLRHAELDWSDGAVRMSDLGSLNGVYVNGDRVACAYIEQGDEVQIGRYRLCLLPRATSGAA